MTESRSAKLSNQAKTTTNSAQEAIDFSALAQQIKLWAQELGFQGVGIADIDLGEHPQHLLRWLEKGYHADMHYMAREPEKRSRPDVLLPGTVRVISVRMDYWPQDTFAPERLRDKNTAYISRYALGRDYHKVLKKRLQKLAEKIQTQVSDLGYRAFVDSAPVLEKPLAQQAGLGWMGKHTLIIHKQAGSYFFLGELLTNLPLPIDQPVSAHCGSCQACIDVCPTQAIVAPYQLDSRKCISWVTIEYEGVIPVELRTAIGNRVFGCDDCQLVCPWNRYARISQEADFLPRHQLERRSLLELFLWEEKDFLSFTEGMALRRASYAMFLRNLAVGLGNAPYSPDIIHALENRLPHVNDLVAEHIQWALQAQKQKAQEMI